VRKFTYGIDINIKFENKMDNKIDIGKVVLSKTGQELARITGAKSVEGFFEYVIEKWAKEGLIIYSDWPKKEL